MIVGSLKQSFPPQNIPSSCKAPQVYHIIRSFCGPLLQFLRCLPSAPGQYSSKNRSFTPPPHSTMLTPPTMPHPTTPFHPSHPCHYELPTLPLTPDTPTTPSRPLLATLSSFTPTTSNASALSTPSSFRLLHPSTLKPLTPAPSISPLPAGLGSPLFPPTHFPSSFFQQSKALPLLNQWSVRGDKRLGKKRSFWAWCVGWVKRGKEWLERGDRRGNWIGLVVVLGFMVAGGVVLMLL